METNEIEIELTTIRLTGLGREGGRIKGWAVHGPNGARLEEAWGLSRKAALVNARRNVAYYGRAWALRGEVRPRIAPRPS